MTGYFSLNVLCLVTVLPLELKTRLIKMKPSTFCIIKEAEYRVCQRRCSFDIFALVYILISCLLQCLATALNPFITWLLSGNQKL